MQRVQAAKTWTVAAARGAARAWLWELLDLQTLSIVWDLLRYYLGMLYFADDGGFICRRAGKESGLREKRRRWSWSWLPIMISRRRRGTARPCG